MKKSSTLANEILNNEIKQATEEAAQGLYIILDSMTDENCEPLPYADKELISKLRKISESLYFLNEEIIPLATEDLIATIEEGW
jgi:hypothetical protein